MAKIINTAATEQTAHMVKTMNEGADTMQMEAISDAGYDPNAEGRDKPETKITKVYARLGSIVIIGRENDQAVEKQITINEAIYRSKALLDMIKTPWKYQSDHKEVRILLEAFVSAIETAKQQLAAVGF